MLRATVSGSFHRHLVDVYHTVNELYDLGILVLSPADPRVVDELDDFLFVASDRSRSVRLVEDRHLECIRKSDFVWLVAPDGYIGLSAAMELGFAFAHRVPVFSSWLVPAKQDDKERVPIVAHERNYEPSLVEADADDELEAIMPRQPVDLTLQQYIRWVPNLERAVEIVKSTERIERRADDFCIAPLDTIETAQDYLERMQRSLRRAPHEIDDLVAGEVYAYREKASKLLTVPPALTTTI